MNVDSRGYSLVLLMTVGLAVLATLCVFPSLYVLRWRQRRSKAAAAAKELEAGSSSVTFRSEVSTQDVPELGDSKGTGSSIWDSDLAGLEPSRPAPSSVPKLDLRLVAPHQQEALAQLERQATAAKTPAAPKSHHSEAPEPIKPWATCTLQEQPPLGKGFGALDVISAESTCDTCADDLHDVDGNSVSIHRANNMENANANGILLRENASTTPELLLRENASTDEHGLYAECGWLAIDVPNDLNINLENPCRPVAHDTATVDDKPPRLDAPQVRLPWVSIQSL